jgi:hypothetical protein
MTRSIWRSTIGAAVIVPALLVVLLGPPLPVAAAPEGELAWTVYVSWTPTGEIAFLSGAGSGIERRGPGPSGVLPSLVWHAPLESRRK